MPIYTYGMTRAPIGCVVAALYGPSVRRRVPGLIHAEFMARMTLGAPVFSPARMQVRHLVMFAAWDSAEAIDDFLASTPWGRRFTAGWFLRMNLVRKWGRVKEFDGLSECLDDPDPEGPVVAVTLARMRLPQVPRFIRWGKPVEELVRDHPGVILPSAAMRLPRTVSTFSIWPSLQEMTGMVRGHSPVDRPHRHAAAMKERDRKDFHFAFTTLRFRPIAEQGSWEGRSPVIPPGRDDLRSVASGSRVSASEPAAGPS